MEILEWWNLIFVLPFVGAMFYVVLLSIGVVDLGHDGGVDIDHGVDVGHHDIHTGIEHSHEVGHEHDHDQGVLVKTLSFLGVGRVPFSIVVMAFCFLWGFSGWAANVIFRSVLKFPGLFIWMSLGAALFFAVFGTRFLALGISRI